jgi:hypothetical protein
MHLHQHKVNDGILNHCLLLSRQDQTEPLEANGFEDNVFSGAAKDACLHGGIVCQKAGMTSY